MQFTSKALVTGIKMFKGEIEGTSHDSTKVFVQIDLDDSRGTAKGFGVQEFAYGTSEEFHKLKHNPFPLECELTFSLVTSGKVTKQLLTNLKPLAVPATGKAAAASAAATGA